MKFTLTCSECIKVMAREDVTISAETLDEACDKAKAKFARKHKTRKDYVNITAIHRHG